MSFFDTANRDDTLASPSAGPRLGFFGAMEAAYDAQVRAWSMFGVAAAFEDVDNEQDRFIRERLGDAPELRTLRAASRRSRAAGGSTNYYTGMARFFEGGGEPGIEEAIAEGDRAIEALRARGLPELLTYREMWELVRQRAIGAEHRWESSTTSWPGMVGGFLGGAVGSMNPRTDPVNALSLGVAPGAGTLVRRLAAASGSNALAETVNQLTGVQENRRLLGLEHSASQAMQQILFAGGVGLAFQGGAEFLAAGARRLRGQPGLPPRPEPGTGFELVGEPYGPPPGPTSASAGFFDTASRVPAWRMTRSGIEPAPHGMRPSELFGDFETFAREVRASEEWMDLPRGRVIVEREVERMAQHLERWDADGLPPRETRLATPPLRAEVDPPWYVRPPEQVRSELGRHYDPELYHQLDKVDGGIERLKTRAEQLRRVQADPRSRAADAALDQVQELQRRIDELRRQQEGADRRAVKRLDREMQHLNDQQLEILERIRGDAQRLSDAQLEAVSISQHLSELQHLRQQLTPLQRHAEDVARGVMDENMPSVEALIMMDRLVAYGVDITPRISRKSEGISQLHGELQPALQKSVGSESLRYSAKPGEMPAETVVRATREAAEQMDDGDVLLQRVREALGDAERTEVRIGDTAYPIDESGVRQSQMVEIVDFVERDGARFAKVRQQDGTVSFWPAERLERVPTIDLGHGPIPIDRQVNVGTSDDGTLRTMTWRQILKEIDDDESMVRAMTTCARS